jgi:O-antigen/teichoic acid export membrane protein
MKAALPIIFLVLFTFSPSIAQTNKSPQQKSDEQKTTEAIAASGSFCFAISVIGSLIAYFIPIMVALFRKHPNMAPILVVNIFLGWTLIGWVVALAWALTAQSDNKHRHYHVTKSQDNPFA